MLIIKKGFILLKLLKNVNMNMSITIKGYITMIKKIEKINPSLLKGFDNLDKKTKEILRNLDTEISNYINEI